MSDRAQSHVPRGDCAECRERGSACWRHVDVLRGELAAPLDQTIEAPARPRLTAEQSAHVLDAMRRCMELLMDPKPEGVGHLAPGWFDLRDHAVAVALRLLREYDPDHLTDMAVGS